MRVEQQNANIIDTLKQSIGPEETETEISFLKKIENAAKKAETKNEKTVNLKDATYLKPGAEEKKTAAEEIEETSCMDAETRKNQMTVLANTTSAEDYARMQEDGFSLDSTASNTIVTETDKIKAQLAKAGVDISCFGDELDAAQLEAIAGSPEMARQLANAMKEADIPYTEENVRDAIEAMQLAGSVHALDDGAMKYLLANELSPTIENLYKAEHSGGAYQAGAESIDISSFAEQVERVIRQAGFETNSQTMADSKWMLENDIALTPENMKYMEGLKQAHFPVDAENVIAEITSAIAEGRRPQDAVLLPGFDLMSQAQHAADIVAGATEDDVKYLIDREMDLTLRNLEYAIHSREAAAESGWQDSAAQPMPADAAGRITGVQTDAATGTQTAQTDDIRQTNAAQAEPADGMGRAEAYTQKGLALLTAKRQLEEVRLAMTIQANYSLLRRGITIDTEPLELLVEQLKNEENNYYANLLKAQGADSSEENIALFRETTEKISDMKSVPAYVLGMKEAQSRTVNAVHKAGTALRDTFERASERYETLMTAPRADLGDSIQKAFRNVDDILQDISLDITEENRRAVRILGYNELDITPESVAHMKAVDEEVQRVFKNMTPAVVTQMIKKGINPLDMDFASLNTAAEEIREELGDADTQKFSEFLWKLEKNDAISAEERESYIGIYRLIHQVEKTDGAVVGALLSQGAEITMRNLMMAVRTGNRSGKMDYTVDEAFGEQKGSGYQGGSVTDQIESSYQNNCLKDAADALTPEKLRNVRTKMPEWENMTPEQFKAALEQLETDEAGMDYAYAREQLAGLEASAKVSENIYQILQKYDVPNTMINVLAMEAMVRDRNQMFRQIFGKNSKPSDQKVDEDDLKEIKQELLEEFGEAVKSPKEMGEAQEKLGNLAENVMKGMMESDAITSLDVRELRLLSAQLEIGNLLAKNEQYSVPVLVSDGVVNVSLKIVRGVEKKGTVDIMMESGLRGKIAATFRAKENGISGLVTTDNPETEKLLEENRSVLTEQLGEEGISLHYAQMADLDLNHFSLGTLGVYAENAETETMDGEAYRVQTARLYRIAESFIRTIRDVL